MRTTKPGALTNNGDVTRREQPLLLAAPVRVDVEWRHRFALRLVVTI